MTGLLICAAVVALLGALMGAVTGVAIERDDARVIFRASIISLALIAVALWLAYAAGAA